MRSGHLGWIVASGIFLASPAAGEWKFLIENRDGKRTFQASRATEGSAAVRLICALNRQIAEIAVPAGRLKPGPLAVVARFGTREVVLKGRVAPRTTTQWAPPGERAGGSVALVPLGDHLEALEVASQLTFAVGDIPVTVVFDAASRRVFQDGCSNAMEKRALPPQFLPRYVVYRGFDGAREQFGVFEKQRDGRWLEKQAQLNTRNYFESVRENLDEVILHDRTRDLFIRLHFPSFRVQARFGPGQQWGDLYSLRVVAN